MALTLPPPPRNRSIWGLLVTLLLVGWTGYLLITYKKKPELPAAAASTPTPGPAFVEIDLRGPEYDLGRYAGYQSGRESRQKGLTLPAEKVLTFSAGEIATKKGLDAAETDDFATGYKVGFAEAMKASEGTIVH